MPKVALNLKTITLLSWLSISINYDTFNHLIKLIIISQK